MRRLVAIWRYIYKFDLNWCLKTIITLTMSKFAYYKSVVLSLIVLTVPKTWNLPFTARHVQHALTTRGHNGSFGLWRVTYNLP